MAEPKKAEHNPEELQAYAFELFAERSSRGVAQVQAEQLAVQCFQSARTFMDVAARVKSQGGVMLAAPEGKQLADACAPNLKQTHPLNLVSQRFGNLEKVRQINAKLEADPKIEELPDLDWGKSEVNTARTLFPAYANN
jgi:hypothetical protein